MVINGKNQDKISLREWVTQAEARPRRPRLGTALLPKPYSGWVGSEELPEPVLFKALLWLMSEPAPQLLSVLYPDRLFAQEPLL